MRVIAVLIAVRRREVRAWFKSHRMLVFIKVLLWVCDSMSRRCSSLSRFIIGAIESAVKGISPVL
uniref:Uncharacterized protein n=1 Tax=Solanum lycopersicum TaxID=4081 RepID=A0A3Q7FYF2_SOLLC